MPASATITAASFYEFSPGSRPRVGQMNANFSALRGHLIPIDPNTISAANLSYDLGSEDYRWGTVYTRKLDISVTTTALVIEPNASNHYVFKNGASTTATITDTGFVSGYNKTPCAGFTSTAAVGDIARSSAITTMTITGAGHIAGTTCTLSTLGRPVIVVLQPDLGATASSSFVRSYVTGGAVSGTFQCDVSLVRNGSITATINFTAGRNDNNIYFPTSFFRFTDFPSQGAHNYSIYVGAPTCVALGGTATTAYLILNNARVVAVEVQ